VQVGFSGFSSSAFSGTSFFDSWMVNLQEYRSPNSLEDLAGISEFFDKHKSYQQTDFMLIGGSIVEFY
jgi:hypothetical protein